MTQSIQVYVFRVDSVFRVEHVFHTVFRLFRIQGSKSGPFYRIVKLRTTPTPLRKLT